MKLPFKNKRIGDEYWKQFRDPYHAYYNLEPMYKSYCDNPEKPRPSPSIDWNSIYCLAWDYAHGQHKEQRK